VNFFSRTPHPHALHIAHPWSGHRGFLLAISPLSRVRPRIVDLIHFLTVRRGSRCDSAVAPSWIRAARASLGPQSPTLARLASPRTRRFGLPCGDATARIRQMMRVLFLLGAVACGLSAQTFAFGPPNRCPPHPPRSPRDDSSTCFRLLPPALTPLLQNDGIASRCAPRGHPRRCDRHWRWHWIHALYE
jgi:hypothetical protein